MRSSGIEISTIATSRTSIENTRDNASYGRISIFTKGGTVGKTTQKRTALI